MRVVHVVGLSNAVRDYILRAYGCVFAVVILMLELNVKFIVKGFAILDNWVIRGAFYGLYVRFHCTFVCLQPCFARGR